MLLTEKRNYYSAKIANGGNEQNTALQHHKEPYGKQWYHEIASQELHRHWTENGRLFSCCLLCRAHSIQSATSSRRLGACVTAVVHQRPLSESRRRQRYVDSLCFEMWRPTRVSAWSNFVLYTRPIGDIIVRQRMQYHCYADDTHIYMTVERDECIVAVLSKVETCVIEVAGWM